MLTRGEALNNPGNLRHGQPWEGLAAVQTDPEFCGFISPEYGFRAMAKVIATYGKRGGHTLAAAISKWAPPTENDTAAYIKDVSAECGVSADTPIDLTGQILPTLLKAVTRHEQGGFIYTDAQIAQGISLAGLTWTPPKPGLPIPLSPAAPSSGAPSPNASSGVWSRLRASLSRKTTVTPLPSSASSPSLTSSVTEETKGVPMTSAVVTAIAPELVAIIKAAQTMVTDMGPDPTKLVLTAGPALQVFLGTVELQAAPAINAEWGAAQAAAIAKLNELLAKVSPAPAA